MAFDSFSLTQRAPRWSGLASLAVRSEAVLLGLFVSCLLFRLHMVRPIATGPVVAGVLQHDAAIFGIVLLAYVGAGFSVLRVAASSQSAFAQRFVAASLRLFALTVLAFYVTDVAVYEFFATRLYVSDILMFRGELGSGLDLLHIGAATLLKISLWKIVLLIVLAVAMVRSIVFFGLRPAPLSAKQLTWTGVVGITLVTISSLQAPPYFYHPGDKQLYENYLERNRDFLSDAGFSTQFRNALLSAPPPAVMKERGRGQRLNVVLIIVESLSAYDSRFFSGIENWTPGLDSLAGTYTALTNFHANGWTTIGGLLSLLTSEYPFVPEGAAFNKWGSPRFADFKNERETLPRFLAAEGYESTFIGAGDLGFMDQSAWLRSIGFTEIVGHDDPLFSKIPRGPFKSVPDDILYDRLISQIRKTTTTRPYFIVAQTFWSHRPFRSPDGREDTEANVIRYSDRALVRLFRQLDSLSFFESGVVIVTGDHRAMEPYQTGEVKRFGASAPARIPGLVATRAVTLPAIVDAPMQQHDLLTSIKSLVSNSYDRRPLEGTFLAATPVPPACVMQARADARDQIYVKCGVHEGIVLVDGDRTRFRSGGVPRAAEVIATINRARLRRVTPQQ